MIHLTQPNVFPCPEFIIDPICLGEVAQNFRTYAEQVAYYAEIPDAHWAYPYNNYRLNHPQYHELNAQSREQVIVGNKFGDRFLHLFVSDGLYDIKTPADAITYSLFAALYIESMDSQEE